MNFVLSDFVNQSNSYHYRAKQSYHHYVIYTNPNEAILETFSQFQW